MRNPLNLVAVVGLVLGAVFGLLGTVVADQAVRASSWAIDSVGLVVATALLAVRHFRRGDDCVAAGFLVFAIGEGVMLSGTAATLEASVPAFAAGASLWSAALLLTGAPRVFPAWTRIVAAIGAILFAIASARIFRGEPLSPIASPLPFFAYPFLVLTFAGWIWSLLRADEFGAPAGRRQAI